jgi:UDP-N-acetylmuramoyl-tripeptide--D-alanyl-D-alanine ligase
VLILGGMAELGADSLKEHEELLRLINQFPWKKVVLVGGDFTKLPNEYIVFSNSLEAKSWFAEAKVKDSFILIKGSRSMQMENILKTD